jgi:AraC-like DNA-binding protein
MQYSIHRPRPPLSGLVEYLWALHDAPAHARERIVPSGTIELVINLDEDELRIYDPAAARERCRRFRGALVSGCYGAPFEVDTREHASIVGVHFRPGGAAGLLGAMPGEIADAHVGLADLWGRRATELRERLCATSDRAQRFAILERALADRLLDGSRGRRVVKAALFELDRPGMEVGSVARMVGLSRRRFIELFTESVGMTPKRYSRVRRFQRALALAAMPGPVPWAEIALDAGYFDQAHLCRDWRELTGLSPADHLALRATRVKENHVAVPERGSNSSNTPPSSRA